MFAQDLFRKLLLRGMIHRPLQTRLTMNKHPTVDLKLSQTFEHFSSYLPNFAVLFLSSLPKPLNYSELISQLWWVTIHPLQHLFLPTKATCLLQNYCLKCILRFLSFLSFLSSFLSLRPNFLLLKN